MHYYSTPCFFKKFNITFVRLNHVDSYSSSSLMSQLQKIPPPGYNHNLFIHSAAGETFWLFLAVCFKLCYHLALSFLSPSTCLRTFLCRSRITGLSCTPIFTFTR